VVATVLAVIGLAARPVWRDARTRMALAIGAAGVALSFGPALPGYRHLYDWLPLLQGVRGAARFGFLALVSVAILAGFGLAALRARWGRRRWWPALAAAAIVAANVEAARAPIAFRPFDGIPRIYQSLRDPSVHAVAEFPVPRPPPFSATRRSCCIRPRTGKPLVNGYSGFVPESYVRHADALRGFPDESARVELRTLGVSHVVVHLDAYGPRAGALLAGLQAASWLRLVASEDQIRIYLVLTS